MADEPAGAQAGIPVNHRPHQISGTQKALHQEIGAALPHFCDCQSGALCIGVRLHQGVICWILSQIPKNLSDFLSVTCQHSLGNPCPAGFRHCLQHIPVMGRRNGNGPLLRAGRSRLQNCGNGIEHMYPPSDQSVA